MEVESLAMMKDPMTWSLLVLPVKKRSKFEVGLMVGDGPRVYLCNLFDIPKDGKWEDIPHVDYEDYEAVVDDGWVVD